MKKAGLYTAFIVILLVVLGAVMIESCNTGNGIPEQVDDVEVYDREGEYEEEAADLDVDESALEGSGDGVAEDNALVNDGEGIDDYDGTAH